MTKSLFSALACATLLFTATPALSNTWLKTGGAAKIPIGHHYYCQRGGRHCGKQSVSKPAKMTAGKWRKLKAINKSVNKSIKPMTDMKSRGVVEHWEVARRVGDCEDYSLLKRSKLLGAGFKRSQLLLAKGWLGNGEAHVVLIVRTNEGDFALNNLTNEIRPAHRSGVRLSSMQSASNASKWVRITGRTKTP